MTYSIDMLGIENASGLSRSSKANVAELRDVQSRMAGRNALLDSYYDGTVQVRDFGITIDPETMENDQVCFWPEKVVSALSDRIQLTGWAFPDGADDAGFRALDGRNRIGSAYMRYLPNCLVHGCMFAVTGRGEAGTYVRFHNAKTAAAVPSDDYDSGGVACGMAVASVGRTEWSAGRPVVRRVNLYEPGLVTELTQVAPSRWTARPMPVPERQPLMVAFAHRATGEKPFGQSRISRAVQSITRDAVRTMFRMECSSAFHAMPQKFLMGMAEDQMDTFVEMKRKLYADDVLLMTRDEEGNVPTFGQVSGNSPQPFVEQMRFLASLLAGMTGVPLASLGVVQDNPSSAQAIEAAREDIVVAAMRQTDADAASLRRLAALAMAVEGNTTVDVLSESQRAVSPLFADPRTPSPVSQADAMVKIASVAPWVAETDVFLERLGFSDADIRRLDEAKSRIDARAVLAGTGAQAALQLPAGGAE